MQSVEEITREIDRQLENASAKLDSFVAGQNASLSSAQQEHEAAMLEAEKKIHRLKMDEAAAQDRAGGLSDQLGVERRAHAERHADVARLEAAAASLPGDIDAARAKEEAAREQLASTRAEYERREGDLRGQLAEAARALSFYETLGLAFEKVGPEDPSSTKLRLVFTQVDAAHPARRCTFCVMVNEADVYEVSECAPPVPRFAELVAELNANNDFSGFVQKMRRGFKAACLAGHVQG